MRREIPVLMEQFPVRKAWTQKTEFLRWMEEQLSAAGYHPQVEESGLFHSRNLVCGDPDTAKLIFSAHYDTPAALPVPNFLTPQNPVTIVLYTLMLAVPSFLFFMVLNMVAGVVGVLMFGHLSPLLNGVFTLALLGLFLWVILAGKANRSNVNDNTSGVVLLLETALTLAPALRGQVAFVWFDHEELGMVGSGRFAKMHPKAARETLLVNFDCVSDGDHFLLVPNRERNLPQGTEERLLATFLPGNEKTVAWAGRNCFYSSDQKRFRLGVGVAAFHRGKCVGLYLGRIHTKRDTVFEEENIALLRDGMHRLAGAGISIFHP